VSFGRRHTNPVAAADDVVCRRLITVACLNRVPPVGALSGSRQRLVLSGGWARRREVPVDDLQTEGRKLAGPAPHTL